MSKLPHEQPNPPVDDGVLVYRLVPIYQCDVVDGRWEFQSSAFDNASPEGAEDCPDDMSVILGDTLVSLQRVPENLPVETAWTEDGLWGVAALDVRFLRHDEGQWLLRTPEDDELAHGDVCGKKGPGRRKRLKKHARWVVRPTVVPEAG